ncbi:GNAT family N-acetyltransferase [Nakamurella antarctica]|uniref:GNAT family N-acetyltransferase n=1 Tax=Nakamurella antarctica TaxID=1902245 RepID=UPI0019D1E18D
MGSGARTFVGVGDGSDCGRPTRWLRQRCLGRWGHAFLIDTRTRPTHRRQGLGVAIVARAAEEASAAGCEWLFVDFEPSLTAFYIAACGFRATPAGLIHLSS